MEVVQGGPWEPGDWLCIVVSDTGEGIPSAVFPHMFEPFFATKAPAKGTGFELAQMCGTRKQHHRHVVRSSDIVIGTVFNLCLRAGSWHRVV